jgi:hypothetical protein
MARTSRSTHRIGKSALQISQSLLEECDNRRNGTAKIEAATEHN